MGAMDVIFNCSSEKNRLQSENIRKDFHCR